MEHMVRGDNTEVAVIVRKDYERGCCGHRLICDGGKEKKKGKKFF